MSEPRRRRIAALLTALSLFTLLVGPAGASDAPGCADILAGDASQGDRRSYPSLDPAASYYESRRIGTGGCPTVTYELHILDADGVELAVVDGVVEGGRVSFTWTTDGELEECINTYIESESSSRVFDRAPDAGYDKSALPGGELLCGSGGNTWGG